MSRDDLDITDKTKLLTWKVTHYKTKIISYVNDNLSLFLQSGSCRSYHLTTCFHQTSLSVPTPTDHMIIHVKTDTDCFFGSLLVRQQLWHDTLDFQFPLRSILVWLQHELRFGRVAGRPCRLLATSALQLVKAQDVLFFFQIFFRLWTTNATDDSSPPVNCKTVPVCIHDCTTVYTTQHRTVMIILPLTPSHH